MNPATVLGDLTMSIFAKLTFIIFRVFTSDFFFCFDQQNVRIFTDLSIATPEFSLQKFVG